MSSSVAGSQPAVQEPDARLCGHSCECCQDCCKPDEAEEVFGLLVVAGRHTPVVFDAAEESFDDVAVAVPPLVVSFPHPACPVRPDAGFGSDRSYTLPEGVTIVSRIGNHMLGAEIVEQRLRLQSITTLAGRQPQMDGTPTGIDRRMNLRRQPPARAAQAAPLVGSFFFSPTCRREPADD
jgi:hypothetical protein